MKKILLSFLFLTMSKSVCGQSPYVFVLGTAQDGGYPQAGCKKECCRAVWELKISHQSVSCIALIDPVSQEQWIFDATPNFTEQLYRLQEETKTPNLTGIFLTHAHIGHYTGLMNLGREAMGSQNTRVFAMPRMKDFLENNGPWNQLIGLKNIDIQPIEDGKPIVLNERISIKPFKVPHRDEYSETVGYQIIVPNKKLIFIPDIDKWQKWEKDLVKVVKENDVLLLDGTFFQDGEINRPMSEVPHPFVTETMNLLKDLPSSDRAKVHFIHLNHTNPILRPHTKERRKVLENGFKIANENDKVTL